jgi:hypothetical protein
MQYHYDNLLERLNLLTHRNRHRHFDALSLINIVMYKPIARQRLGKHTPAEAYAGNNRTSVAKQRISKQAFTTIEGCVFYVVRAEGL